MSHGFLEALYGSVGVLPKALTDNVHTAFSSRANPIINLFLHQSVLSDPITRVTRKKNDYSPQIED